MASLRGEVIVEFEGRLYRLALDFNAFALFESLTGLNYADVCAAVAGSRVSATHARALTWAMAQKHHKGLTLVEAGEILSERPGLVREAYLATNPTRAEQERLGN